MENEEKEEQEIQKTELQSKAVDIETKDEKGENGPLRMSLKKPEP